MKYFGIFDEITVTNLSLKGKKTILIRIFEPNTENKEHPLIINESQYASILELYIFDYVKEPQPNELNEIFQKLNNFIFQNDFDEIIVHCTLGMSRSPAIMICIAKILNNLKLEKLVKDKFKFYNKFIVKCFEYFPYSYKNIEDNNFIYAYSNKDEINLYNNINIDDTGVISLNLTYKSKSLKKFFK